MQSTLVINKCGERFFNVDYKQGGIPVDNFNCKYLGFRVDLYIRTAYHHSVNEALIIKYAIHFNVWLLNNSPS